MASRTFKIFVPNNYRSYYKHESYLLINMNYCFSVFEHLISKNYLQGTKVIEVESNFHNLFIQEGIILRSLSFVFWIVFNVR